MIPVSFKAACDFAQRVLALTLAAIMLAPWVGGVHAHAETTNIDDAPDAMQQQIEASAQEYDEAVNRVAQLEAQIEDGRARAFELEEQIPLLQEGSEKALGELYKLQREGSSIFSLVLSSTDFGDFINRLEYMNRVFGRHFAEVERLASALAEQDALMESLMADLKEAREQQDRASAALVAAQAAREQAQRAAQEKAAQEAEAAQGGDDSESQEGSPDSDNEAAGEGGSQGGSGDSGAINPPKEDDADWSSDKATFVGAWAGRIDAYLAGSPLSGQGAAFAEAAWDYGVDPRFSPAISCVESSKGAACFAPHNAWGWGSVSWSSWEEAIPAHVRGLARGYGYTVSVEGAKKYCPPNWEHWYNRVSEEMGKI